MKSTSFVRAAVLRALYLGAASLITSTGVMAQGSAQSSADELQTVVVTGSRIARADTESTQPVMVVSREEIEATGLNNMFDILNNLSISDGSGLSTVTTQTNGSDGSQQISLRGFGSSRTLVLVDGRRWATDIDSTVDLSTIPVAIIERVEVLKDGASAIYGSDAIGGVINLITRRDYDGASVNLYRGATEKGDGVREAADISIGASSDRASGVVSVSYSSQEEIMAGTRTISSTPYYGCAELAANPNYTVSGTAAAALGIYCGSSSTNYGRFAVSTTTYPQFPGRATLIPGRSGAAVSDFRNYTNAALYNFAPVNYLQQPAKRGNAFLYGRYDLTDDISAFVRASYTKRTSTQQLAEVPLTMATSGANGPQWTIPISASHVFNPFGQDINTSNFRMVAAGPRSPSYDYDIFSTQAGLDGKFEVAEKNYRWELFAQYNDGQYDSRGTGYINLFNLRSALGPSFRDSAGVLRCGTVGNVVRNCVPFNIFGGPDLGLSAGRITKAEYDAMVNWVSYTQVGTSGNSSFNYGGLISGDLFELPGGMAGFAVGFENRKDDIFSQPDTLVASGGSSDNYSEPTVGIVEVKEYFGELVLPLAKDITGLQLLELSLASRKSDYSASGLSGLTTVKPEIGSPTTAKYGFRWKPIDDLLIRGSWGETFRAPSVSDLFGGGRESFPSASDPCRQANWANLSTDARARCVAGGVPNGGVLNEVRVQLRALLGGNPFSLKPENGENWSAGFVYSPSYVEGLDVAVDYWKIELTDAISTVGATSILSGCYTAGNQPQYCSFVERTPDGAISSVRTSGFNLNEAMSEGVDIGVSYRLPTENYGNFQFKLDWAHLLARESNGVDYVGEYTGANNWKNRANLQTGWQKGDFSAVWTVRYTSSQFEECWIWCYVQAGQPNDFSPLDELNHTGSTVYHDLQVSYNTPWKGRLTVGGRNILGKEPPILQYNSFAHSFDAGYDIPGGGFWYLSYKHDF